MRLLIAAVAAAIGFGLLPAQAQDAPRIMFEGDIVLGVTPRFKGPPPCVLNSHFQRGDQIVFRMRMNDPRTGKQMTGEEIASATVELANGQKFPMKFGPHPPKDSTDTFWTAAWIIPADHPTGTLTYKVTATRKDGGSASWAPFNVAASQFRVVAGN